MIQLSQMKSGNFLFIDIGNTRVKTCACVSNSLKSSKAWSINDLSGLDDEIANAETILICSVSVKNYNLIKGYLEGKSYRLINHELLRDYIDYETPESLGMDRVVAAVGAWKHFHKGSIVVDSGTASTIDMINDSGVFCGGVIMPGIGLMEGAFRQYTELPAAERKRPSQWPPRSTENALKWGVTGSYLTALSAHILKFKEADPGLKVAVTGGDGHWVADMLENEFEIEVLEELVFRGMREISEKILSQ